MKRALIDMNSIVRIPIPTHKLFHNLTRRTFGRWSVESFVGRYTDGSGIRSYYWRCKCSCGAARTIDGGSLRSGNSSSCGCLARERTSLSRRTHGMSQSSEHRIWRAMRTRCSNPNQSHWQRYGGRGIKICERWNNFQHFFSDMGPRPPKHSIERRNNDGDYCPENCYWATARQQGRNMRTNRILTFNGRTMPMASWADAAKLPYSVLRQRIKLGWTLGRAFTEPVGKAPTRPITYEPKA